MLRHVAMFRWSAAATDEARAELSAALDELPERIASVRAFAHGPDAGLAVDNWDHVVVADFDDEAAYLEYRDHPDHQAVIAEKVRPILAERAGVQYLI